MKKTFIKIKKNIFAAAKRLRVPFVIILVTFTIIFSIFRALTPWVAKYKAEVTEQLSLKLDQKVSVQSLETSWYWFRPVLKLNSVRIEDDSHRILELNKLLVGVDLIKSLWSWRFEPGILYLGDADLVIWQRNARWEIDGINHNQQALNMGVNSYLAMLSWLLSQESIIIKNLSAKVHLQDGDVINLNNLNFKAVNRHGHYKIYGNASLLQSHPTAVAVMASLDVDKDNLNNVSGSIYLSLEKFLPSQWLRFLPETPYQLRNGLCNLNVWFNIKSGRATTIQSKLDLKKVVLFDGLHTKSYPIDYLRANLAWKKNKQGWLLSADKVDLQVNGVKWPQNKLSLAYKNEEHGYDFFIKTFLIDSLRALDIDWPKSVQDILQMRPIGELYDTQIHVREDKLTYVLTRFINLGWNGRKKTPGVRQISGVLFWEPNEGRLVLDGEKTTLLFKNLTPQSFDVFNADIYWKQLNNGLRVDIDRFVLSNANLVLSSTGVIDNFLEPDSKVCVRAKFAAKNVEQFFSYIPSGYLKPKFEQWLKQDVKKINNASGRVLVDGKIDDFPFDGKAGKFIVSSHVSGVDLAVNSSWPVNRDIDADLEFNKRSFSANVGHANLQGIIVNKLNLVVNNIGYGTESLLIHGEVEDDGRKIKKYIYKSPLKNRLARFRNIDINDPFWMDIKLDIPLYPENAHVAALGEMVFSDNPVHININDKAVIVDDVSGSLKFNEYGLTGGELQGVLDGFPVSIRARSQIEPREQTVLNIDAKSSIVFLKNILNLRVLDLFSGDFNLNALWTIYPEDSSPDNLHLATNLEGVGIFLPDPLKKSVKDKVNLTADLSFFANGNTDIDVNYNNIIRSKLLFAKSNKSVALSKGELRIGGDAAKLPTTTGVIVSGVIDNFDATTWWSSLSPLAKEGSSFSIFDVLSGLDLQFKQLILAGKIYKDLYLKAKKVDKDNWSINFTQENFTADLAYSFSKKSLKGVINNLSLNVESGSQNNTSSKWSFRPEDIPNIDLSIKSVKIKNIDAGGLNIKTTSSKKDLILDSLELKSSDYKIFAEGRWDATEKKDTSFLKVNVQINDLAKSLERLHVTPVVHSHNGQIILAGNWDGPIYDFNVHKFIGDMRVSIRDGRISNFDKEVEEKLGLGKLLSILSLQTIPRRLKLDFSDLAQDGYSFDIFKGNFNFKNGTMTTQNSYIDGPVAYAKMTGNIDLEKQLYDVNLRIIPYITASLPVVATIAGGPVAGFATWVASSIISKGMQSISGYTYKVSGPWSNPVVQQVKIYRKKQ